MSLFKKLFGRREAPPDGHVMTIGESDALILRQSHLRKGMWVVHDGNVGILVRAPEGDTNMSVPTLNGVPLEGAELDAWNERQVAYVSKRREIIRDLYRKQARKIIEALPAFGGRTGDDYRDRAANLQARVTELQDIILFGGSFTPAEQAEYDAIKATFAAIKAIRAAEGQASAALDAAGLNDQMTPDERIAEIEAVPDVEARLA